MSILPRDIATGFTVDFIQENGQPNFHGPRKILEVGCGLGHVAKKLMNLGHDVSAIDSSSDAVKATQEKGVRAQAVDFFSFTEGPFDVVLFTRSLHHIIPLEKGLLHTLDLLKPGGVMLVEDFDWQNMDGRTARWFYGLEKMLYDASQIAANEFTGVSSDDPLTHWTHDHTHEPPLNTGGEMKDGALKYFEKCEAVHCSYLFRYFCRDLEQSHRGHRVAKGVFELESRLLRENDIQPVGLRLIAHKKGELPK